MCTLLYSFLIIALTFDTIWGYQMGVNGFNQPGAPGLEQSKELQQLMVALKEKCDQNGGSNAFESVMMGQAELQECVASKFQGQNFMAELQEVKMNNFDESPFKKYCSKIPEVINCVRTFTEKVKLCVEPSEKPNVDILVNIIERVAERLCNKNGDLMSLFIAEGGLECLSNKIEGILECGNKTITKRYPKGFANTPGEKLPLLTFDSKNCDDFDEFHDCTVGEMKKCDSNGPANVVNLVFNAMRDAMPCKKPRANKSSLLLGSSFVVLLSSLLVLRI